jgi:methionine sulfoxide reductase heme-binding subunit
MSISLSGLAAYLLLWASSVAGVAASFEFLRRRAAAVRAHETLALAGLGVALLHTARSVITPQGVQLGLLLFAGIDVRSEWGLALGVLALYLTAVATVSFYVRGRLGRWWRAVHTSAYLAYAAALWHSVAIGANTWFGPVQVLYVVTAAALAVLTLVRIVPWPVQDVRHASLDR